MRSIPSFLSFFFQVLWVFLTHVIPRERDQRIFRNTQNRGGDSFDRPQFQSAINPVADVDSQFNVVSRHTYVQYLCVTRDRNFLQKKRKSYMDIRVIRYMRLFWKFLAKEGAVKLRVTLTKVKHIHQGISASRSIKDIPCAILHGNQRHSRATANVGLSRVRINREVR